MANLSAAQGLLVLPTSLINISDSFSDPILDKTAKFANENIH